MHWLRVGLVCLVIGLFSATSVQSVTFTDLANKVRQIYDLEESRYPLYQTPGFDADRNGSIDTLASLEVNNANLPKDQLGGLLALLLCSPKPTSATDYEAWGNLRKCLHASNDTLMRHHIFQYINHGQNPIDKAKVATHAYLLATELDALSTGIGQANVFQITRGDPASTYKLRDTARATGYALDTGAAKDFAWAYDQGLLPRYYCTTLEEPFDPGASCKTINLWERIRQVMAAMTTRAASEWLIKQDGTLRAEFWDSITLWDPDTYFDVNGNFANWKNRNTIFNPSTGNGWYDLLGRRTMGTSTSPQNMHPGFFLWQWGGMADTAKIVLNEGGIYQTAYDKAIDAFAFSTAFDPANWLNNNSQSNSYGQPVRALSNYCNGSINMNATDPLAICQGGKTEWYRYWSPDKDSTFFNDLNQLAYNAQHLLNDTHLSSALPQKYQDQAINFYYAFKANFYKDGDSYINFANGGFDEAAINRHFAGVIGECHDSLNPNPTHWFFKTSTGGPLIWRTSETAAELLPTFLPYYVQILALRDSAKATELTNIMDAVLTPLLTTPLSPTNSDCALGSPNAGSTNNIYARRAGHTADLLLAYNELKQLPVVTLPKACDANADGVINGTDERAHLGNFYATGSDCTNDINVNSFDYASTAILIGRPVPPAVNIPITTTVPDMTAVADFDATAGDIESGNRSKVSVLSADGKKVYHKFYDNVTNKMWDSAWTITDVPTSQIGQQTGLTAIRSFNQAFAPGLNQPRQTIVAANGLTFWIRFYSSGAWQPWVQSTTSSQNLPNGETKMANFTMTAGDASDAVSGVIRPKMMILSADGTKIYYKYFNTNNSNQWDSSWGTNILTNTTLGSQLGVNAVRSFTQSQVLPMNQPMQQALSIDGRTRYERYWSAGAWGAWKVYPATSLAISGTTPALLPMP